MSSLTQTKFWVLFALDGKQDKETNRRYFTGIQSDDRMPGPRWCGGDENVFEAERFSTKKAAVNGSLLKYNHWSGGADVVKDRGFTHLARVTIKVETTIDVSSE